MATKNKKRSNIDFKNHELHITETDNILIHHLKQKHTICLNVKFINTNGVLVITGDFGNWIFCREFHPSIEGQVSDHYWCEKLEIGSVQESTSYDFEETLTRLRYGLRKGLRDHGYTDNLLMQAKEFYKGLIFHVEDEIEYINYARENCPNFMDYGDWPHEKTILPRLKIVFDAFDEICKRLN